MKIAAYVRVSTDDQNEDRQMRAIRAKYAEPEQNHEIDWFCDLGESGASTSRREYQRLREHIERNTLRGSGVLLPLFMVRTMKYSEH
jgi:DNA invertase Pin-like site-specific DNA recombinase